MKEARHVLSFLEGMDKDTEFNKFSNMRYLDSENFEFIYDDANSTGILTNSVGDKLQVEIVPLPSTVTKLLGWTTLRDKLILFILSGTSTRIYEVPTTTPQTITIGTTPSKLNKVFGHDINTEITAIGRYESDLVQKVYWVDGKSFKYANLADSTIQNKDVGMFESYPEFNHASITLSQSVTGNLRAGKIQYAYQLYNVNGSASVYSGLSNPIVIAMSNSSNTSSYRGSAAGVNTGKGCIVEINGSDTRYERIKVIRIHYGDGDLQPAVNLIADISNQNNISIRDITLDGLGQIDFAEFIATKVDILPKTIETKNNILFAGNVEEKIFDIAYDATLGGNVTATQFETEFLIDGLTGTNGRISAYISDILPGFQRDELYRFGIVLYDKKMRPSFVKPIGDIRIEDNAVAVATGAGSEYDNTKGRSKRISFMVNGLPESVAAYQIVYVKRDSEKRSVVDWGVMKSINTTGSGSTLETFFSASTDVQYGVTNLYEYNSPNYLYNNSRHIADSVQLASTIRYGESPIAAIAVHAKIAKYVGGPIGALTIDIQNTHFHRYVPDTNFSIPIGNTQVKAEVRTSDDLVRRAHRGSCIILSHSSGNHYHGFVVARRRKNLSNMLPNQSNFYGPIESNVYVPCSEIVLKGSGWTSTFGDTYVRFFEYTPAMYNFNSVNTFSRTIQVPIETTIDLQNITNPTMNSLFTAGSPTTDNLFVMLQEVKGVHIKGDSTYVQDFDLYKHNAGYSRVPDAKQFIVRPTTLREDNILDTRVYASERKINVELEDNWLTFRNFLDIEPAHGPLTKLHIFKNELFFFQPRAIGVLSVDQRELAQKESSIALTLGTGGVLDRFDYLTTSSGTSLKDSICNSRLGIYYVDDHNKAIARMGEAPEFISDLAGMKSFLRNADLSQCIAGYNPRLNTVLFKIGDKLLSFNENIQKFTTFYTSNPSRMLTIGNKLLTLKGLVVTSFGEIVQAGQYRESVGTTTYPSKITFVIKPEGRMITRMDVLEILSYVYDNTGVELPETFSSFKITNSYQSTGTNPIPITNNNAVRRMRNWRINQLRNAEDEGRLKDSYFKLELIFTNGSNKTIKLSDIVISHFPVRPY
jgi:hypothetical protein